MVTYDEICDRIEAKTGALRQQHGYRMARCPAHEDSTPSLEVKLKDNDWVSLRCYAGCEEEEILQALELSNIDLMTTATNWGEPEKIYTYQDEDGDALFQVLRYPGKRFRQRRYDPEDREADKEGWVWKVPAELRVPYHLPQLIEGVKEGRTVYVVEGEKDVGPPVTVVLTRTLTRLT